MKVAIDKNILQLPACYTVMADKFRRRRVPCWRAQRWSSKRWSSRHATTWRDCQPENIWLKCPFFTLFISRIVIQLLQLKPT